MPRELADAWRVDVDRVYQFIDSGKLHPSALLPKSVLPGTFPGTATYVEPHLDNPQHLPWERVSTERMAPLTGAVQLFRPDLGVEDAVVLLG